MSLATPCDVLRVSIALQPGREFIASLDPEEFSKQEVITLAEGLKRELGMMYELQLGCPGCYRHPNYVKPHVIRVVRLQCETH